MIYAFAEELTKKDESYVLYLFDDAVTELKESGYKINRSKRSELFRAVLNDSKIKAGNYNQTHVKNLLMGLL